jgi:uridine phosphorylase
MKQPHILCSPEQITPYVLLPGDPARTERIAKFLTGVEYIADNREFRTVTGFYEGLPVTVTSTGIGGASLAIALEELIQCGGRYFIRTGSCGACQEGIGIGDLVLSTAAVREDGASRMYVPDIFPAGAASRLTAAAETLLRDSGFPFHVGITRSHDSFYIDNEQERMAYWSSRKVLASDMETAALYVIASLRGVQALSILNNVVLYQGNVKEGIGEYVDQESAAAEGEKREILIALKTLKNLEMV